MKGIIILKSYDDDSMYKIQKTDATWEFHDIPAEGIEAIRKLPEPMPVSTNITFDNPKQLTLGQIWQEGYNYCLREITRENEKEEMS